MKIGDYFEYRGVYGKIIDIYEDTLFKVNYCYCHLSDGTKEHMYISDDDIISEEEFQQHMLETL